VRSEETKHTSVTAVEIVFVFPGRYCCHYFPATSAPSSTERKQKPCSGILQMANKMQEQQQRIRVMWVARKEGKLDLRPASDLSRLRALQTETEQR